MLILSPEEIRKAEATANKDGLSYEDMMESAGSGCAEYILKNYPDCKNVVIICGKGKNGGDGFVIARYLNDFGKNVSVILAFNSPSDELSEKNKKRIDGLVNFFDGTKLTKRISSLIQDADIIVDAVFGIGFKGSLPENIKTLFEETQKSEGVKIAVDIPSGLSCENDDFSECIKADETLSMLCFKKEHIYKPYSDICGKVTVIPIGFSLITDGVQANSPQEIKALLPERPVDANKGTFGKALIIAGSYKMPGASVIATKGALTMGAGLSYLAFPDSIYNTVTAHLTECVFRPLVSDKNGGFSKNAFEDIKTELSSFDAVAIGPGMGTDVGAEELVKAVIKNYTGKLIIDADGINIISRNIDILKESKADILLTPHPGEMARLTGLSAKEVNADRINIASEFSQKMNVTVLLKGVNTVISSPDGRVFINPTGSDALARGGSGDLLTGITVSLSAQGLSAFDAAITGAYIHGLAGDISKSIYTGYCSTVERIYNLIPKALSKILSGQ